MRGQPKRTRVYRGRKRGFAASAYAPATKAGLRVLAHELTHVVQNRRPSNRERSIDIRGLVAAEREAERVGARVAEGLPAGKIRKPAFPSRSPRPAARSSG